MISSIQSLNRYLSTLPPSWQELISQTLEEAGISDLQSPQALAEVRELDLSRREIDSLAPLRMFTHLEVLDITGTQVSDITPLMYLPYLRELHACFCNPFDLNTLIALPGLKVLDLSYPRLPFGNLEALSDLDKLEEGYFNACQIDTVAHFMTLPCLQTLSLPFNPIAREEIHAYRELFPECRVIF